MKRVLLNCGLILGLTQSQPADPFCVYSVLLCFLVFVRYIARVSNLDRNCSSEEKEVHKPLCTVIPILSSEGTPTNSSSKNTNTMAMRLFQSDTVEAGRW